MYYIDVIVDNNSKHTDEPFTYASDVEYERGAVVQVPFGTGNRVKRGFVLGTGSRPDIEESRIKKIMGPDPDIQLTEEIITTSLWMKQRYGIRYMDAIRCFLPPGNKPRRMLDRIPYPDAEGEKQDIGDLTREQEQVFGAISRAMEEDRQRTFLIHGVTGSGKTEVYMQAISRTLDRGKGAIMLVPEIALTKQIIERFVGRFGRDNIAVLHSRLTRRERYIEWQRLRRGEARIAIGARLAAFAPMKDVGLVIMDEEHEATYKSDQTPKYDTVDVVTKRLMSYRGLLLLGSATPSVVSYSRAEKGIYTLLEMKKRYNEVPLPAMSLVDMKEELKAGNISYFSREMIDSVRSTIDQGLQTILFLNRRGYATYLTCEKCGVSMKCPECGITLVYHKKEDRGICHYCGRSFPVPDLCPTCGEGEIRKLGAGTEKIEELTSRLFPDARVERLDLDTTRNKGETDRILNSFSKGKTDILIGTQLVAKGLDFRNVGLVGVISADSSLNIPDYRSTERTFQLVTQVSGRAGRGDRRGRVVVQSYDTGNFALKAAENNDYKAFYDSEIALRKLMDYPPFSDLILAEFTSEDPGLSERLAGECRDYLINAGLAGAETIYPPKQSWNFKGENSVRYNILIKAHKEDRNEYLYYLMFYSTQMTQRKLNCNMTIDVNPYSSI